jgi:hypothetical protein
MEYVEEELTKLQKDSIALMQKSTLSEREILNLKHRLNKAVRANEIGGSWNKLGTPDPQQEIILNGLREEYDITTEQTEKGLNWLRRKLLKNNGEARNGALDIVSEDEIEILRNYKEFKFVGFEKVDGKRTPSGYTTYRSGGNYFSIWRVVDINGDYFDYTVSDNNTHELMVLNVWVHGMNI